MIGVQDKLLDNDDGDLKELFQDHSLSKSTLKRIFVYTWLSGIIDSYTLLKKRISNLPPTPKFDKLNVFEEFLNDAEYLKKKLERNIPGRLFTEKLTEINDLVSMLLSHIHAIKSHKPSEEYKLEKYLQKQQLLLEELLTHHQKTLFALDTRQIIDKSYQDDSELNSFNQRRQTQLDKIQKVEDEISSVKQRVNDLRTEKAVKQKKNNEEKSNGSFSDYISNLLSRIEIIISRLNHIEEYSNAEVVQELLQNSCIIFSTLCTCGISALKKSIEIDDLLIDEAAATTESELAIPFYLQPKRLLAVGDPKQLPATVVSPLSKSLGLDISLHERIMKGYENNNDVIQVKNNPNFIMLDRQYRMRPEISSFPSQQFYQSRLMDGCNVTE